jgi:phage portal protein BeeE
MARRDPEGATVYTPSSVTLISHGDKTDSGFMVEGRNAVRLDVANMTGVPAALLDGSVSQSSLTYSTQEGRRNEFVDYGLSIWMNAVTGRLSADDVVARGLHVVFDQTQFLTTLPDPIGPKEQD